MLLVAVRNDSVHGVGRLVMAGNQASGGNDMCG